MTKKLTVKVSWKDKPKILRGFGTFPLMSCGNSIPMSILSCSSVKTFKKDLGFLVFAGLLVQLHYLNKNSSCEQLTCHSGS